MSISIVLRFKVLHRDLFTCQYCGRQPPEVILEVDHIIPYTKRTVSIRDNKDDLVTSCRECNRGKNNIVVDKNTIPCFANGSNNQSQ